MNELKNKIIEALNDESETLYGIGSCGELGDSVEAIISDYFSYIADKILDIEELKQLKHFQD